MGDYTYSNSDYLNKCYKNDDSVCYKCNNNNENDYCKPNSELNNVNNPEASKIKKEKKKRVLCDCDNYVDLIGEIKTDDKNIYELLLRSIKDYNEDDINGTTENNTPWKLVNDYLDSLLCGDTEDLNELKGQVKVLLCKLFTCSNDSLRKECKGDKCSSDVTNHTKKTTLAFRIIGYICLLFMVWQSFRFASDIKLYQNNNLYKAIVIMLCIFILFLLPFSMQIFRKFKSKKYEGPYTEFSIIFYLLQKIYDEYNNNSGWILPGLSFFMYFFDYNSDIARYDNLFIS